MMSVCLPLSYILHGDYYQALPLIPLIKLWKQVYRRMIKCCGYLQCHTQVAVLCQFLDETDYSAAFKALQERNTHDAMDAYYSCIWDITILEFLVRILSFWKAFFERIKHVCWFTDVWVFCCTVCWCLHHLPGSFPGYIHLTHTCMNIHCSTFSKTSIRNIFICIRKLNSNYTLDTLSYKKNIMLRDFYSFQKCLIKVGGLGICQKCYCIILNSTLDLHTKRGETDKRQCAVSI